MNSSESIYTGSGFNPLPSPKQGETGLRRLLLRPGKVSIRSPHRSKGRRIRASHPLRRLSFQSAPLTEARGDRIRASHPLRRLSFQSAPLTEARGDRMRRMPCGLTLEFQSAPLTEARGDRAQLSGALSTFKVSIRSPHRSKGRLFGALRFARQNAFQSAPLTEARGDI